MQKLIGCILAPLYTAFFLTIVLIFHPIQVLALRLGGYGVHKKSVDLINLLLLLNLRLAGARITVKHQGSLPADKPLIVVSNHQSLYDIPLLGWVLRAHHLKYVSKKELGRGIPSVSYNLRHGGSVLINRKNPRQALSALSRFGAYIERNCYAACIFPEGTRGRNGIMKPFKTAGVVTLLQKAPSTLIVPVAIDGSWELARYGFVPIPFGVRVTCTILEPIPQEGRPAPQLIHLAEERVRAALKQPAKTADQLEGESAAKGDSLAT
jgi:1-acyl-sn-glycerol-3-phosphate acyltransferase